MEPNNSKKGQSTKERAIGVYDVSTNMLKRSDEPKEDLNDTSEVIVYRSTIIESNVDALGNSIN